MGKATHDQPLLFLATQSLARHHELTNFLARWKENSHKSRATIKKDIPLGLAIRVDVKGTFVD